MDSQERIDVDRPLWSQDTFLGRAKHFFWVTDPRTALSSNGELDEAKRLVEQYRLGNEPPGTTRDQVIYAKKLYESAFHPDSGERQNVFGRMSFQVPGGMAITGCMLQFYRTVPAVVFWQWVNQSFNALVNYTNRNAKSPITTTQLGVAYVSATTSALVTALGLRKFLQKRASTLLQRYVPFAAVAAANCVNIPLMRQNELIRGIDVCDENGNIVGQSKFAAAKGISQVVTSRIAMAAPGMTILPVIMEKIESLPWMQRVKPLHAPLQVLGAGAFLLVMTPVACAIFPQRCSLSSKTLSLVEPDQWSKIEEKCRLSGVPAPSYVYFNKGL
ncbi:sideroflexin-2 [Ischnura elegans]|uniref:sideroflexin-2 n=1 Tax=Ischnura elegans TaxID=197161 RepID=UPI001ED8742F|nr:sideroflexin-2 [Ischnura elegans]XP_046385730.1 sideroflexin-2 [Ischnura elegans]